MIIKIYRRYLSETFRNKIYILFLGRLLEILRRCRFYIYCKLAMLLSFFVKGNQKLNAYVFMNQYGWTSYPGMYSLNYKSLTPSVLIDEINTLPFIFHNGKRLYFPASFSQEKIGLVYRSLLIEQDVRSPHRYVVSNLSLKETTLLDIGAAEGIFSLDVIDYVDSVYLFECDEEWIPALSATVAPWNDKVHILKRFIGHVDNECTLTIDSFMRQIPHPNKLFLKMDIEGAELQALQGAKKTLMEYGSRLRFAICTYHSDDDKESISSFLSRYGYKYEFTKGFLFISWCLRTGIVRSL